MNQEQQKILSERLLTAEQGVLGSMLIDGEAIGPMLAAVRPEDFQRPENRNIFQAFRELYGQGKACDPILVNEYMGGSYRQYLADLMELTPTAANAEEYARVLRESSRLWRLRTIGDKLAQAEDLEACRKLSEQAGLLLCDRSEVRKTDMKQGLKEFFLRHGGGQQKEFIRWGISWLDERLHIGGGDMVVIGGQASSGKTAFALQLAFHIARQKRVGFFSYETGNEKLIDRTVACQTLVSYEKVMTDKLEREDMQQIYEMRRELEEPDMEYLETNGWTVSDIGAYAMARRYDVIVVDYLQKIAVTSQGRYLGDYERVSRVSSDLQQLGRQTGRIIIALSQLSRPGKDGLGPTMSSLRSSGQIEQDADVVLLLYRENEQDAESRRKLVIAKNKDGRANEGTLLEFDGDNQRFRRSVSWTPPERTRKKKEPAQTSIFRPVAERGPTPFDEKT
jgi:replicative DNA helicase